MKIDIDLIKVDEASRIRQDSGNISKLQESISNVGLINPILIDEQYRLIAGYRRLCACKNLKWKDIEVRVVELDNDELKMLEAEAAENMYRIDFTPEEILAIHKRREAIIESRRPKGFFERCWSWLKSLFSSQPRTSAEAAPQAKAAPQPIARSSGREPDDGSEKPDRQEQQKPEPQEPQEPVPQEQDRQESSSGETAQPGEAADPEAAAEKKQEAPSSVPKQPKSAEIVEKNGMRHIKWR
jgi:ParB family chromosome partitioning protein